MDETNLTELRHVIRELIESEALEEFSGVGAVAGFTLPLGATPEKISQPYTKKTKKKKKLKESTKPYTYHNYFRYNEINDDYCDYETDYYYDGVTCLARAFGSSDNPFGTDKDSGVKRAEKYLQGQINYPHLA
jgi:hypothetical protein